MKLHGVWVDTVVEKPTIWRCRCGAMLSTQKAMMRHAAGDTMCQHRGEGMVAYVPESPGPEGAIPKQQAGLHDDELLEKVEKALVHAPTIRAAAAAAVAAVRGAGPTGGVDSLASARGLALFHLQEAMRTDDQGDDDGHLAWQHVERARSALAAVEPRDDRSGDER